MKKKEIYNYGTLLALIKEQNEAHEKQKIGRLGWLGKSRMKPRDETIFKFAKNILHDKAKEFSSIEESLESINSDLAFIASDKNVWDGVSDTEIKDAKVVFTLIIKAYRQL